MEKEMLWRKIFPPRCPACDAVISYEQWQTEGFCKYCGKDVVRITGRICDCCGRALSSGERGMLCGNCQRNQGRLHFYQGRAVFAYSGPLKDTMYRMKYEHRTGFAELFVKEVKKNQYLDQWIRKHEFQGVLAVPMYKEKQRRRGYNQAELLAREISREYGIPMLKDVLERVEDTRPQKELEREKRKNNLKNAFKIRKISVKLTQVLVIDDIFTTGGTIDEIASVLQTAGVQRVYYLVACIGRGERKNSFIHGNIGG